MSEKTTDTASLTIHFSLRGYQTDLTVYGASGAELLKKAIPAIDGLEKMGATPTAPPAASNGTASTGGAGDAPICPYHGPMKRSKKFEGWYCAAKMGDGSYCKEQVK